MRDDHYRDMCEFPGDYDNVIDAIKVLNHACRREDSAEQREEFAVNAVHDCIRTVMFGDCGTYCCTGGAMALRVSRDPKREGYKKVLLAVRV